jgi:saccharopine dehydrogenase (NAD+, L-lysine-forming)
MLRIGLIREGKIPSDARVALSPAQCATVQRQFPVEIRVEPSPIRCFTDREYADEGIALSADLGDCDVLLGV